MTRLLVVGLGRQGSRHARLARQVPGLSLAGTVDPHAPGTGEAPHFEKLGDALAALRVDAAVVATPTVEHAGAVRELLACGVPTLAEKPLAPALEEAEELVEAAEGAGVLLAVGHVERFNPAVALVSAMLRAGSLGPPISVAFRRLGLPPPGPLGVDVVHDLAVHDIDVFGLLAGHTPRLVAVNGWPAAGLAESAHLLLAGGGVNGSVQVDWRTPVRIRQFSVTTEDCYVEADYTTQKVEVVQPPEPAEFVEFREFQSHYGSARRVQLDLKPAEPLAEELTAFAAAVRGEESPLLALGRGSLDALRIADEATRRMTDD